MPVSDAIANSLLDGYARNVSFANAAVWCKLHTGDPGASGTTAAAANTTRQQATFGSAASGRAISNTVAISWTTVPNAETYSWLSFWTASTAGTFTGRVQLTTPRTVAIGDTFTIAIGDLDLTAT